jgi:hypothetical protein
MTVVTLGIESLVRADCRPLRRVSEFGRRAMDGLDAWCGDRFATRGARLKAELKATPPRAIVLDARSIHAIEVAAPTLLPWIEERYEPVQRFPTIAVVTKALISARSLSPTAWLAPSWSC